MRTERQHSSTQSDGAIKDSLNIGGQPFRVLIIEDDVELARLTLNIFKTGACVSMWNIVVTVLWRALKMNNRK